MKTFAFAVAAATLASALAVAPAQAEEFRLAVKSADLDVHSAAGAATLAGRVEMAVAQACTRSAGIRDPRSVAACQAPLLADAAQQLDAKGATLAAGHVSGKR